MSISKIVPYGYIYPEGVFHGKQVYKYTAEFDFVPNENLAISFDIETSAFNDYQYSTMYIWAVAVEQSVYIGRTWNDFDLFINRLIKYMSTYDIHIFIHNAAYEFSFLSKRYNWSKVFAIKNRKPLYFTWKNVTFHCSHLLSGLSLKDLAKQYCSKGNQKLVGDLDYSKVRYCNTPVRYNEVSYLVNDTTIVTEYIHNKILEYGTVSKIPLTNTGVVRQYCREKCLYKSNHSRDRSYTELMKVLTLDPQEYLMLRAAYTGGFTHANHSSVLRIIDDVDSFDFNSSYPAVMCSEVFPMSKGRECRPKNAEQLEDYLRNYCCIFNITFEELESKYPFEHYLSISKAKELDGRNLRKYKPRHSDTIDNGRIVCCKEISFTLTEIDWQIIKKTYSFKIKSIGKMIYYERGYLPKPIIECVLHFYQTKTTLKDVEGQENIYMLNKGRLNSTYGMIVTNIIRDIFEFSESEWKPPSKPDLHTEIEKYNKSKKRFLFYPWGVWVVKYATRNLWSGILSVGEDYRYSDTDSVKITRAYLYEKYFAKYNISIQEKIKKCLAYYDIDPALSSPCDKNGREHPLGVWEHDGSYVRFKTLGAKRYFVEYMKDGYVDYKATVAGCPKSAITDCLKEAGRNSSEEIFKRFDDELYIPKEKSGKLLVTYIDEPYEGIGVDYLGNISHISEKSCCVLSPNSFDMSLSDEFLKYLQGYSFGVDFYG